jgi:hypothetical protein
VDMCFFFCPKFLSVSCIAGSSRHKSESYDKRKRAYYQ